MQLIQLMNDRPPAMDSSWTVGRKEPVLALHEGLWQRGLAIRKKGLDFAVFLVDAGQTVTVSQENMRSLPQELRTVPPFLYQVGRKSLKFVLHLISYQHKICRINFILSSQVCLAGVAPKTDGKFTEEEIGNFQAVMTDGSYPLVVEFLGQLPGGRWLVRMEGKEDGEDVAKFLVENGAFAVGKIPPVSVPTFTEKTVQLPAPVQLELVKGPIIDLRTELEEGCEGTVKCLETPDTVHIFPTSRQELFLSIQEQAQASTLQGEVDPVLGTACLAKNPEDGLYYRAEILQVNKEDGKASLFQIDHGKVIMEDIKMLKLLPKDLAQEPGLLTKVSIRGLKPVDVCTDEQEEMAKIVMDVGGPTVFRFTEVKQVGTKLSVNATDVEGSDLASLLLEVGLPAENGFDCK